jgi:hypothetical protein
MVRGTRTVKTLPRIGDRVVVPFGRGGLEGEVIRTSTTLTPPSVTVEVWLEGADEPTIVTYPADRIRPAEPAKR